MSDGTRKFAEGEHTYCSFVPSFEGSSSDVSMTFLGAILELKEVVDNRHKMKERCLISGHICSCMQQLSQFLCEGTLRSRIGRQVV